MNIRVFSALLQDRREDGVWLYEPHTHALLPYLPDDIRTATGLQDFVGTAPLNLVYVAHGERMTDVSPEERRLYASVDTGFIGQNVYLFCASEGLASVFRAAIDYAKLTRLMRVGKMSALFALRSTDAPRNSWSDSRRSLWRRHR